MKIPSKTVTKSDLFYAVAVCCLGLVLLRVHWKIGFGPEVTLLSLGFALIGLHYANTADRWRKALIFATLLAIVGARFIDHGRVIYGNHTSPHPFDYYLYWSYGQASSHGLNPYDQDNLLRFASAFDHEPGPVFMDQFYFFQTPPTLLLFAPLGWFDFYTGVLVWDILHEAVLIICIILLWRSFFSDRGVIGLLATVALVLLFPPTVQTVWLSQVNFLLMLFLLLLWRDRDRPLGGVWMALGVFVKPILLIMGLYLVLKRRWQSLGAAVITMIVVSLLTILMYGPKMFFDFFTEKSIAEHMPVLLYYSSDNQSLLGTLLRATSYDPAVNGAPLSSATFWVLAVIFTGVSSFLVLRIARGDWGFVLILSMALLLFPKTLWHYSFYLLMPMMFILQQQRHIPGGKWLAWPLIFLLYSLTGHLGFDGGFPANLTVWLICASLMVHALGRSHASNLKTI